MNKSTQAIMNLIGSEVCGTTLDSELYVALTEEEKAEVYQLSKRHDLAHLVGNALLKNNLLTGDKWKALYQQEVYAAIYRYETISYELKELRCVFNEAQIPFIPLKGAVIRKYYPEPWMRTSCDIDVLVKECDLEKATKVLVEKLKYLNKGKSSHDMQLYSLNGVHVELHYDLLEEDDFKIVEKLIKDAWGRARRIDKTSEYEFDDETFYLYHIAHMSKHIVYGGCGIRPFLDTWLLNNIVKTNKKGCEELFDQSGLSKFAEEAEKTSEIWFNGQNETDIANRLGEYVLYGGVYGTIDNRIAIEQGKKGKIKYVLSRIWMPYKTLKIRYPSLEKRKWMLPLYEVRRWIALLFDGGAKYGVRELKLNAKMEKEKTEFVKTLMKDLGLE